MNRELAAVGAGRFQQIADHRLQLLDVAQHDLEVFLLIGIEGAGDAVQKDRHELINRS